MNSRLLGMIDWLTQLWRIYLKAQAVRWGGSRVGGRRSVFEVRSSKFEVRSSEFGVRRSEFGGRGSEVGFTITMRCDAIAITGGRNCPTTFLPGVNRGGSRRRSQIDLSGWSR